MKKKKNHFFDLFIYLFILLDLHTMSQSGLLELMQLLHSIRREFINVAFTWDKNIEEKGPMFNWVQE